MISRKDLIKKEYHKILETKLPNIFHMINQEKFNASTGANTNTLIQQDLNLDYDDTQLLSLIFNKDQSKSSLLYNESGSLRNSLIKHYDKNYHYQR